MLKLLVRLAQGAAWLLTLALVLGLAGLAGTALLDASAEASDDEAPLPVAVFEAQYQDTYLEQRRFAGRIAPSQVANAGFQIGGEVIEVSVDVGDRVEAGDVLAALDPTRIDLAAGEASAALSEAGAELTRAENALRRVRAVEAEGFATAQEVDDALAARNAARERVRRLERSLARVTEDAGDAKLRAPFSGYVVERYVDSGATVAAGQPVVRLNENAALEAAIGVPAVLAGRLSVGDRKVLMRGDDRTEAVITGISDDIDVSTRSRLVRLAIEGGSGFLPGSLVRIVLPEERRGQGIWVPLSALTESYRGLWSVYVAVPEDAAWVIRRKDVEILSLGDGRAFVTGTIEDGDLVVANSPFRFVPGQRVEPVLRSVPGPLSAVSED